jgi:hypothetical protein
VASFLAEADHGNIQLIIFMHTHTVMEIAIAATHRVQIGIKISFMNSLICRRLLVGRARGRDIGLFYRSQHPETGRCLLTVQR